MIILAPITYSYKLTKAVTVEKMIKVWIEAIGKVGEMTKGALEHSHKKLQNLVRNKKIGWYSQVEKEKSNTHLSNRVLPGVCVYREDLGWWY